MGILRAAISKLAGKNTVADQLENRLNDLAGEYDNLKGKDSHVEFLKTAAAERISEMQKLNEKGSYTGWIKIIQRNGLGVHDAIDKIQAAIITAQAEKLKGVTVARALAAVAPASAPNPPSTPTPKPARPTTAATPSTPTGTLSLSSLKEIANMTFGADVARRIVSGIHWDEEKRRALVIAIQSRGLTIPGEAQCVTIAPRRSKGNDDLLAAAQQKSNEYVQKQNP